MKKKEKSKDLVKVAQEEGFVALLREAAISWDAISTGIIGTEFRHLYMIPGRLVQAVRNKDFITQLAREFEELKQKGKIKPDYIYSEQGKSCLQELLSALEEPPVDENKFNILKAIFLRACREDKSSRDDALPALLMTIAKTLSSGEILLLAANYKLREHFFKQLERPQVTGVITRANWVNGIKQHSELNYSELVESYEETLVEKKLLTSWVYGDRSGVNVSEHGRLTELGYKFCEFIIEG